MIPADSQSFLQIPLYSSCYTIPAAIPDVNGEAMQINKEAGHFVTGIIRLNPGWWSCYGLGKEPFEHTKNMASY